MPMEMEREDKHRLMQQLVLEQTAIVVQSRPVEQARHGYLNGKKFFSYLDVCTPYLILYRSPTDC
jgi:hypothetical protein